MTREGLVVDRSVGISWEGVGVEGREKGGVVQWAKGWEVGVDKAALGRG